MYTFVGLLCFFVGILGGFLFGAVFGLKTLDDNVKNGNPIVVDNIVYKAKRVDIDQNQ